MKNFINPVVRLLTFTAVFLFFIVGCSKDYEGISGYNEPGESGVNSPKISIDEAKSYFQGLNLTNETAYFGAASNNPFLVKIDPDWNRAYSSNSQSGHQIIVVPLYDSLFQAKNQGRAKVQLLFHKWGQDSIIIPQLLLSAATPEYHATHANNYSLSDFSGAFAFFDLAYKFQYGLAMYNGAPIGRVDSVGFQVQGVADDRDDDCIITDIKIERICEDWEWASTDCITEITIYLDCNGNIVGGGGGGGGNGGGTGGNNGGSSGGGSGSGSGNIDTTQTNYPDWYQYLDEIANGEIPFWKIYDYNIPLDVFIQYGGYVPTNQESSIVTLNNLCNFTSGQLNWLNNVPALLPYIQSFLNDYGNSPEIIDALKDVIDARINGTNLFPWVDMAKLIEMQVAFDLPEDQLRWVIENSKTPMQEKVITNLHSFFEKHGTEEGVDEFIQENLDQMMNNPVYKDLVLSSMGWPPIVWTIVKELVGEKAIDILFNLIPGFNKKDEIRDGIKALANGEWLGFTWEVAKIIGGQLPLFRLADIVNQLENLYDRVKRIENLIGEIGEAALERAWNILRNSTAKFSYNALKYVENIKYPRFGLATSNDWRGNYRNYFPDDVVPEATFNNLEVHHAVPRRILTDYPNFGIDPKQMHSVENLRGISKDTYHPNGQKLHTAISSTWQTFLNAHPNATLEMILDKANEIDNEFGSLFIPPVRQ